VTLRILRADGQVMWLYANAVVLRSGGRPVRMLGASLDITELKRVEEELRRVNQDLEQFAYTATHDLQEPLRGVKIYSELLAKRYGTNLDGQALQFLDFVRGGASRMEMLLGDLLAYTQLGKLDTPVERTDAAACLRATLDNLAGAIAETGATITSDPLPHVHVYSIHLQQLFQNLIGNAIKYRHAARRPVIHIRAEPQSGAWQFSVEDNGIGIEPEYKERIFGLFKRLHTGDQYAGTGIGLAICQRIVERYQGRIWVESQPGEGSTFRFILPG
jgi:light-regulated signal transduction histidine kinase (bacteriophytochrome)